ncbi:hypothetical protein JZU56_04820, partial [bacterium]|nr:hypothetical protein [bacterium]
EMPMTHRLPKDGILLRSITVTVLAFILVGIATVVYTAHATSQRAMRESDTRLNQLLDTVESTLRVACFVKDDGLAREVARGLLSNTEVLRVVIQEGSEILADLQRSKEATAEAAKTPTAQNEGSAIESPFKTGQIIGQIRLTPDPAVIAQRIREDVSLAALQLFWQLALIASSVVITLLLFVVRPISAMSGHLHRMDPMAGDRLPIPAGHGNTEIGRLANAARSR